MLNWRQGVSVADVGAGAGHLAIVAARLVGPSGRVFASEIDPRKLDRIRRKTRNSRLINVTVVEAKDDRSGLPPACCDGVLLRGSYHHFTNPAAITADLYRSVRPGGVAAIVDFPAKWWLSFFAPLKGVPADRGGHGIPANIVVEEMTAAGFKVEEIIPRWFFNTYCLLFRKPPAA
jgi:SAM-dependent methyltransferase